MSWDVASIYPHNCPSSSWCHLFGEVHQSLLQQSTPTTWCCQPCASRLRWCSSACTPPPSSSKHNNGHYHQTVCFIRPEDISPKSTIFVPVANRSLAFFWRFWSNGFFLAERPIRLCRYRKRFTVDIETLVPVSSSIFPRTFDVGLGLICTFRTKVR